MTDPAAAPQEAGAPRVIQLRRTKGWRKPEGAVVVARGKANDGLGRWGNPFPVLREHGEEGRRKAEDAFRFWLVAGRMPDPWDSVYASEENRQRYLRHLPELRGKTLACWCPQPGPCHAHVLAELAGRDR